MLPKTALFKAFAAFSLAGALTITPAASATDGNQPSIIIDGDFNGDGVADRATYFPGTDQCRYVLSFGNTSGWLRGGDIVANFDVSNGDRHTYCPDLAASGDVDGSGADELIFAWSEVSAFSTKELMVLEPLSGKYKLSDGFSQPSHLAADDFGGGGTDSVWVWSDQTWSMVRFKAAGAHLELNDILCAGRPGEGLELFDLNSDGAKDIVASAQWCGEEGNTLSVVDGASNNTVILEVQPDDEYVQSIEKIDANNNGRSNDLRVTRTDDYGDVATITEYVRTSDGGWFTYSRNGVVLPQKDTQGGTTSQQKSSETVNVEAAAVAQTNSATAKTSAPLQRTAQQVAPAAASSAKSASKVDSLTSGSSLALVLASQGAQLDGAQLDGAQLDGAQLDCKPQGAQLDGAQLDGAQLDCKPKGAQLDGAQLDSVVQGAQLDGAQLDGAQLDGAQLDGAQLDGAQLDCKPKGAQLDGAQLDSVVQGAQLDGAQLDGAQLDGAQLDCTPKGAQLDGAQLDSVVQGAQLDGAQLDGAQLDCKPQGAPLDGAQLDGAQLDCTPKGAQLDGAQLDCKPQGAQLDGAQLDGAQLDCKPKGAQLDGAQLD